MIPKYDKIGVIICLLFAIVISFYHLSYDGYLGLNDSQWGSIWAIAENGFSLTICILISLLSKGILKSIFKYLFIPYFIIKLVYHFSCYSGIYLFSKNYWEWIWSIICIVCFIVSILIIKNHVAKKLY
jgi:hypothetical protein